jgi:hypothetical protein
MIKKEILEFIEANIDLEPTKLKALVKKTFKNSCPEKDVDCLCRAVEETIKLYKQYPCDIVSADMHARLMDKLRDSCK